MRARTRTIKIKKKIRKIKKQNKVGRRNAIERGATTIVAKIWLDCVSTGFLLFTEGEKGYTIVWLFFIIIGYFINNYEITVTLWRAGISDGRAASTTGPFFVRLWCLSVLRIAIAYVYAADTCSFKRKKIVEKTAFLVFSYVRKCA